MLVRLIGLPRVVYARLVMDRFNAANGSLLAAGIAYNAVLALIPIALLAAGLAGFILTDPASQAKFIVAILTVAPPLAGVIDEIVGGLAEASPSVSIIGLLLAGWGTSRLFASLESGIAMMFVGAPRRGFVTRAVRRVGSIAVTAGVLLAGLLIVPGLSIAGDIGGADGPLESTALTIALAAATLVLVWLAVAAVYLVMPPQPPSWRQVRLPAAAVAVALLVLTRGFTLLAPRLFGANAFYGTIGAVFVGLAWLDLVFVVILVGAAWVRERAEVGEAAVA